MPAPAATVFSLGEPLPLDVIVVGELAVSVCSESVEVGPLEHGRGWAACIGKLRAALAERLQLEAQRRGVWALQVRDETVFPHYDAATGHYWLHADIVCDALHRPAKAG